ncbi:hypothetical protein VNO78_09435 [Psophocarpus tetragonolobus]|uniref:Uncharacterized protein n=1 Tax=Psophocarpus tetragonolobus TaxID=3891 RepID=A0AAN9XTK2_PSOTE
MSIYMKIFIVFGIIIKHVQFPFFGRFYWSMSTLVATWKLKKKPQSSGYCGATLMCLLGARSTCLESTYTLFAIG